MPLFLHLSQLIHSEAAFRRTTQKDKEEYTEEGMIKAIIGGSWL